MIKLFFIILITYMGIMFFLTKQPSSLPPIFNPIHVVDIDQKVPAQKPVDLPADLPKDIQGKLLYIKSEGEPVKAISFPQLLDFQHTDLSDQFNNAPFLKPSSTQVIATAWSPDGTKFVTFGLTQQDTSVYQPNRAHNDIKLNYKVYLYDLNQIYSLANNKKLTSYEPMLLKTTTHTLTFLSWSPDGSKLAYWENWEDRNYDTATNITTNRLVVFDLETKQEKVLVSSQDDYGSKGFWTFHEPAWSADSSKILFLSQDQTDNDNSYSNVLYLIDVITLNKTVVIPSIHRTNATNIDHIENFDWLNNQEVLVSQTGKGVYRYNLETKQSQVIINRPSANSLSPNKKYILSAAYGYNENPSIIIVDINKGLFWPNSTDPNGQRYEESKFLKTLNNTVTLPTNLLPTNMYGSEVYSWSPDSKYLAVNLQSKNNSNQVWILDLANKKFIQVPQLIGSYNPSWSK